MKLANSIIKLINYHPHVQWLKSAISALWMYTDKNTCLRRYLEHEEQVGKYRAT